jgi:integrase
MAEMPATTRPAGRRALTPEQASVLLSAMAGHRLEGLFVVGLMLGLRPGELTGLGWSDADLEGSRLVVDVSLKYERKALRIGETQTATSRRPLSIPVPVGGALRVHRRRQLEERLMAGAAWQESGLVFATQVGIPIDPANLRHAFVRLTEKAGLGHWTPNEQRHSAASLLSAAGVPLEVIADVLGHASTRMLQQHYRHQVKPSIDGHVTVMEQMFGARPRPGCSR